MIIGHCIYHVKKGKRDEFLKALAECRFIEKANQEPGNLYYTPYLSLDDENAVFVAEAWECDNLDAHFHTPHIKDLDRLTEIYLEGLTSDFYNGDVKVAHNYQTAAELLSIQK